MHFVAACGKYMAFCGRHIIYIVTLRSTGPYLVTIDLLKILPNSAISTLEKNSLTCLDISRDTKFLVAADSDKRVYLFERIGESRWDFQYFFETEKRCIKILFDARCTSVILTDRCGDVWMSHMTVTKLKTPRKIVSNSSLVLDTLITRDNQSLFTSDREDRIIVSKFPEAYVIDHYFLGHRSCVVSFALIESEALLLSLDSSGKLKMWSREDKHCVSTHDLRCFYQSQSQGQKLSRGQSQTQSRDGPSEKDKETGENDWEKQSQEIGERPEFLCMKVTEALGFIWIAVKILSCTEIPILKLKFSSKSLKKVGQVRMESLLCDMCWTNGTLYVYMPENYTNFELVGTHVQNGGKGLIIKKFDITEHGVMLDSKFVLSRIQENIPDIRAFVSFNKQPFLSNLQQRFSNEQFQSQLQSLEETPKAKSNSNDFKRQSRPLESKSKSGNESELNEELVKASSNRRNMMKKDDDNRNTHGSDETADTAEKKRKRQQEKNDKRKERKERNRRKSKDSTVSNENRK